MMTVTPETIWIGHDNVIELLLANNCEPIPDLSSVQRVTISIGGVLVDSDVVGAGVIWWTDQRTYRGSLYDVLKAKLGGQSIPAGSYSDGRIVVYDAVHPNGQVWTDTLRVEVD